MDEQKSFPTAMFGFSKDAVLDYIYEVDASHKDALDKLTEENARLGEDSQKLRDALQDAAARIEEAGSQHDIIKAQLYNAKEESEAARKETEALRQEVERLRKENEQLAAAASDKEKELQVQLELNKKYQSRCTALQGSVEDLTAKAGTAAQNAAAIARAASAKEINALREDIQTFRSVVAKKLCEFDESIGNLASPQQEAEPQQGPDASDAPASGEQGGFFR